MQDVDDTRPSRGPAWTGSPLRLLLAGVSVITAVFVASFYDLPPTARPLAHPGITTSVTWTRDVAQILERRCTTCHRPFGAGPMDLTSYDSARPWARAIREEVLERRMPPTGVRSGAGMFLNSRTLSWAESELLVSWADGGAPEGTAAPSPMTKEDDRPGAVDLRATPLESDPDALERTARVSLSPGWVHGWSLEPGGWAATSARVRLQGGGTIGSWVAGDLPVHYPEGTGFRVPTGEDLLVDFTLGLPASQKQALDTPPTLRVWRSQRPLRAVHRRSVAVGAVVGATDLLLALKLELSDPVARAEVVLRRRDGSEQFLLAMGPPGVPDPVMYRLRDPLRRTVGDTIAVRTTSPFVLEVETVASVGPKSHSARE